MSFAGRYFSERDINLFNNINDELLKNIIQTEITFFKICADVTKINIYGESSPSEGKQYYPGIDIICLIDRGELSTDPTDFGPERKQNTVFKFMEKDLQSINLFPQTGDLIFFRDRYYECDDIVQEQLMGGIADKSFSVIVNTHYTSLSKIDLVSRQT